MRRPVRESAALVVIVIVGLAAIGVVAYDRYSTGYSTSELPPLAVRQPDWASAPNLLEVVVPWPHEGMCEGQLQATADERPDRVVVTVKNRESRGGGACGGVGTNGSTATTTVSLASPIGERLVYADGQSTPLPVLTR